jgi:general secretion pathway protein N
MIHRQPSFAIAALVLWCVLDLTLDARAQSTDHPDSILSNPLEAQSLDRLSATRDRPLFSPSRRPPPPPPPVAELPAASAPPPPPPPNVRLFGIVIDGEGARAIVRSGTEKVDRVQIGDNIGGWQVSQIEGRHLVLSLDGRFAKFTLFSDESSQQSSAEADGQADKVKDQPFQETTPHAAEAQQTRSRKRRKSQQ